jgi:hypothetical protein
VVLSYRFLIPTTPAPVVASGNFTSSSIVPERLPPGKLIFHFPGHKILSHGLMGLGITQARRSLWNYRKSLNPWLSTCSKPKTCTGPSTGLLEPLNVAHFVERYKLEAPGHSVCAGCDG